MIKYINSLFKQGGRISRREYFFGLFLYWILVIISAWIVGILIEKNNLITSILVFPILWGSGIYLTINSIIKRLHDLGKPGSHLFFLMIPLYNVYIFFILLLQEGEQKTNEYGDKIIHEKKISTIAWIGIIIGGISFLISILIFSIFSMIKDSGAYQLSIETLNKNEILMSEFGKSKPGFFPIGKISTSGQEGNADLQININGEKKDGTIYIRLKKEKGKWSIINLTSIDESGNKKEIIK